MTILAFARKPHDFAQNNAELQTNNLELQKQAADVRNRIHSAVGQVVLALTVVPRYRHQSIADLQSLVLEHGQKKWEPVFRPAMRPPKNTPLMRDRIAIATPAGAEGADNPGGALAGIAFWATVSDAVDAKIREQIKANLEQELAFPIRLKPDEWASGEHVWLLDVVAPSQKMASSVLANFKQVVKQGGDVRIHPMVARQVDPELLKKMGAAVDGGAA
jgi:cytolysin-activating lysine-acyltransferase